MGTSMAQWMDEHYGNEGGFWIPSSSWGDDEPESSSDGEECPRCKTGTLKLRTGKYGKFWGCSNYPRCKYTKDYDTD